MNGHLPGRPTREPRVPGGPAGGQRPVPTAAGRVLPEGRLPAAAAAGQADVRHQLHGNGQGHRGTALLPTDQGSADQSYLTAYQVGSARHSGRNPTVFSVYHSSLT